MNNLKRMYGRKLPIPSTLQILHELLVFSAAEEAKRQSAKACAPAPVIAP